MMASLGTMKARIASELARTDLTAEIANAIGDAIAFHERRRFWFNQTRTLTINTVAGQSDYGAAANPLIPGIVKLDGVFQPSGTSLYPLDRYEPLDFEMVSANGSSGRPTAFTFIDGAVRMWPTPNAAYALRVQAHYKLPALTLDDQSNAWTTDAEELIRTHAKQLLYLDVMEDDEGAKRMQAKIPALLDALDAETSSRMGTGRIRATSF